MIRERHRGIVLFPGIMNCSPPKHSATLVAAKPAPRSKALVLGTLHKEGPSHTRLSANWPALQETDGTQVLVELVELLEDYSPMWYTDEFRERAQAVLKTLRATESPVRDQHARWS